MLIIRQEQIDLLAMGTDEEFVEFLVEHVKDENYELEEKYDDETLREMVRNGLKRAKRHGFKTAEDLTAFVSIMFAIAPNFDEQPQIKAVLNDENFPPEARIERLWSPVTTEEAWEEAENNYNENAWFPEREKNKTSGN